MAFFHSMVCRECGETTEVAPAAVCESCFGPLEVDYEYSKIADVLSRQVLASRPFTMWRYHELLPIRGGLAGLPATGGTPLVRADRLAAHWGAKHVYLKNDSVNFPTLSFKDRVVAVAINAARTFGFDTIGCASTGNLANSVAAQAAAAGMPSVVLIPHDLETSKINATLPYGPTLVRLRGTYDDVNRLCSEIAYDRSWGFVNINLRAFYAEGSKTMGFEIAEQLDWRFPDAVVVPMAGGALINKIRKSFEELGKVGLAETRPFRIYGAQAEGCNPITLAVKSGDKEIIPQRPATIAKSLAIGNPADGYYAARTMRETGGWGEDATDAEIQEGMLLLARTEGIFTETAGGVTVAVTQKLLEQQKLKRDDVIVLCITGNGLKTQEALPEPESAPIVIEPALSSFDAVVPQLSARRRIA